MEKITRKRKGRKETEMDGSEEGSYEYMEWRIERIERQLQDKIIAGEIRTF